MSATAAVLTPRGPGAIATVKLCGGDAREILTGVFRPSAAIPSPGQLAVGRIVDGGETIDQVVLACEGKDSFAINCHGSPLVIELVMELLGRYGAAAVDSHELIRAELMRGRSMEFLAVEAHLTQLDSLTVEGTRLIANQVTVGLLPVARRWLEESPAGSIEAVRSEASAILGRSSVARAIIHGARVVLTGPPNSGKSTLLNCLTGRATSIVADIPGTTRDYVTARFAIPSLSIEVVDTAGLGRPISIMEPADLAAQDASRRVLESADVVVVVLDSTRPLSQFDASFTEGRLTITVLNKRDLVPLSVPGIISVSAGRNENIAAVVMAICKKLGVDDFDLSSPVCFTSRQHDIMQKLACAVDAAVACGLITELINGPADV